MDQRTSELERNDDEAVVIVEEETVIRVKDAGDINARPATSSNVAASERDITEDLRKLDEPSSETTEEPEQTKEQIEQTRSQMSETINAIEERLSFSNISGQVSEHINNAVETAKDAVYDATLGKAENIMKSVSKGFNDVSESVGETGTHVVKYARRNPLPLALIGLGVGMLLMQGKRSGANYSNGTSSYRKAYNQGSSTLRQVASTGTDALSSAKDTVTSAAGSAYEGVGNVANSAYEGVSGAASSAYQGVSHFASSTGQQVQQVARKAQNQYEHTLEENPLAIGAIALAVRAIVGLAIPSTSYENQLLGETRENLVNSVEDVARDAFSRVQEVAGEVTKTVKEQAQAQTNG